MEQKEKILVVDDQIFVADSITSMLDWRGYQCQMVYQAFDALNLLARESFDLVLTDINMPGKTGIELLHDIMKSWPDTAVVLMTALSKIQDAVEAMKVGASDYIEKPVNSEQLLIRIERALERRRLLIESRQRKEYLEREVQRQTQQIRNHYLATLDILISTLGFHDTETKGHSRRVAAYTRLIAKRMRVESPELEQIELGALLHDVGKVGVPDTIIRKPGRLTDEEWTKMQEHPVIGYELLWRHEFLRGAAPVVKYHHEHYSGNGYPERLSGAEIPLSARIFSVVDAFDAITSKRSYKEAKSIAEARAEINRCAGTQFDPKVVEVFNRITDDEFLEIRHAVAAQFGE